MKKPFLLFILLLLLTAPPGFRNHDGFHCRHFSRHGSRNHEHQPGNYVPGFYLFALTVGGVLALGAIVYGGILYAASAGDPSKQSEGREWIWSALIGLLLLAGAYIVLYTINPDLVNLTLPQLTMINIPTSTSSSGPGNGTQPCYPPSSGACSHANNLSCFGGQAAFMQNVCDVESRGNAGAPSGVDIGADNNPVSYGLFQINISANYMVNPATAKKCLARTRLAAVRIRQKIIIPQKDRFRERGSFPTVRKACRGSVGEHRNRVCHIK